MSLYYETHGDKNKPLLVAVHGLMGGADELKFLRELTDTYYIIFVDFHEALKKVAITNRDMTTIEYDKGAELISEILENDFNGEKAYFFGSSYGGKIVFDLMAKYPKLYAGGVFGDISPAPIEDTEFFELTSKVIPQLDMTQKWPQLKLQIKSLVEDRNARSLLASQIYYPDKGEAAIWRTGVNDLNDVMMALDINNQWDLLDKICQVEGRATIILIAEKLSSISPISREKLMERKTFTLVDVPGATHFINITHHNVIVDSLRDLVKLA
jgi:pimeloyl-ACP methyl ester carboxylesterase